MSSVRSAGNEAEIGLRICRASGALLNRRDGMEPVGSAAIVPQPDFQPYGADFSHVVQDGKLEIRFLGRF